MDWSNLIGRALGDNDEYEIIAELGRGGSSHIYRAWDRVNQREVAIKVIPNDADDRQGFARRFDREVQAFAQLHHPNIVEVYGNGETDELVYLVMQCVIGGTLQARLGRPLPISEAAADIIQMAQALHHAHQHGVIHRDVKPTNMLVDEANTRRLLLTDFGIAKIEGMRGLTTTGKTVGTPEYMAPEQAEGREVDHRADIYALGCVLYEALTGRPPFMGPKPVAVLYQQVHARPPYLRGLNPQVPRDLVRVVQQALAKSPEERFDTAQAFAQALQPYTELRDSGPAVAWWSPLDSEVERSKGEVTATASGQTEQAEQTEQPGQGLDMEGSEAGTTPMPSPAPPGDLSTPERPTLQPTQLEPGGLAAERHTLLSARREGRPVAPVRRDGTAQPLPRLTPPLERESASTLSAVMGRSAALWPDFAGTTVEMPAHPTRRRAWAAEKPTGGGRGGGRRGMALLRAVSAGRKRSTFPLRAAGVAALAVVVIASGVVLLNRAGTDSRGNASATSSAGVLAPGNIATGTSGVGTTATPKATARASVTAAGRPANTLPPAPSATATGTPLPPQLTIDPNPWSLSQTGLFSRQCSSGGRSQTVTNAGPHAVSWAWQSSGAPSPSGNDLRYRLNGGDSVTGLPGHASLAAGGRDTLALQMDCTGRTYTVSVLATDLVTGAQASVTFALRVSGGGL